MEFDQCFLNIFTSRVAFWGRLQNIYNPYSIFLFSTYRLHKYLSSFTLSPHTLMREGLFDVIYNAIQFIHIVGNL